MTLNKAPKGWIIAKLGDVCKTTSGGTPSRKFLHYYTGNIPWVKSGELRYNTIFDTEEKITEEAVANSSAKVFPKGTLLVALYGANIGRLAVLGVEAATNQAVCGIFENQKIDSKYLYFFLFHKQRDLIREGIGGAQPNISQGILKDLELSIPPLPEQHRIVAKIEELFSELDNGIANLQKVKEQLKIYRQSVLKWAFEGKLTNKVVKDGELPEGWILNKISSVADINPKIPNKNDIPDKTVVTFLPMKLVEEVCGVIHLEEERSYGKVKKGYTGFIDGDVIFAKITPCMENGKIAIVDGLKNGIGCGSTEFHVLRCKDLIHNKYLFFYLVQERFRLEAEQAMTGAVGQKRVQKQYLMDQLVPTPTLDEQHLIVQEIDSRLSVADKLEETIEQSLKQSDALRQSILKTAFEGKLVHHESKI